MASSPAKALSNGHAPSYINGNSAPSLKTGLKILIVGAGIGGLTAALALRQQGHEVLLFEQSRFVNEAGAAIPLTPNANGVLRRLGIRAEEFGANAIRYMTEFTSDGKLKRSLDVYGENGVWQHKWLLAHRAHLHTALRKAATSPTGAGRPVQLHTSSKVFDVDSDTATVTLQDGKRMSGDIVIGADGTHSITRRTISADVKPFPSGKNAFRFLIAKDSLTNEPELLKLLEKPGEVFIWLGPNRQIVMYPTTNNTILNFACVHPDSESEGAMDWNTGVKLEKMLEVYKGFSPKLLALLRKADPATLKVWKLLDMDPLSSLTKGRFALIGDAAHPFLPHQGQGGACAIEDAVALSVVLPRDTPRDEIVERLKLYDEIRYERAHTLQEYSRLSGREDDGAIKIDLHAYAAYNFGHDEFDYSTQQFRKWIWSRAPHTYWRMPIAFGPTPGPRQDHLGRVRQSSESTFTTASIKFKTSRTLLQNLFPPHSNSYRFTSPGTVAFASFTQTTLNKMEWLGGAGYNHIGLYIHGVEYVKKDSEAFSGTYLPILFENLADPIVSGREELGMPTLYSTIDVSEKESSYQITTGWQGAIWGRFYLEGLVDIESSAQSEVVSEEVGNRKHMYQRLPQVGTVQNETAQIGTVQNGTVQNGTAQNGTVQNGTAENESPVFVSSAEHNPTAVTHRVRRAAKASFNIDPLDWKALPTLHHVISRLAEIPLYEVVDARIVEGTGVPDIAVAKIIE